MKRISNIFAAAAVSLLLTGCGIYNKYEQKVEAPANAFGADGGMLGSTLPRVRARWRKCRGVSSSPTRCSNSLSNRY